MTPKTKQNVRIVSKGLVLVSISMAIVRLSTMGVTSALDWMNRTVVDFDTDPGWTGFGNSINDNNYGYSIGTINAGGEAGEVGGTFGRNSKESHYADTHLSQTFTPKQKMSASGKLKLSDVVDANQTWFIGHMSSSADDYSGVGIEFMDNYSSVKWRVRVATPEGGLSDNPCEQLPIDDDYFFQYTYDPNLSHEGDSDPNGRITARIYNASGSYDKTLSENLHHGYRSSRAKFDAFGIGIIEGSVSTTEPGHTIKMFIDDVSYTGFVGSSAEKSSNGLPSKACSGP
jgi:hypothetical protein